MTVKTATRDQVGFDQSGTPHLTAPKKANQRRYKKCRAEQLVPRLDISKAGSAVAIDCEGVILDDEVSILKNGCGRVSVVAEDGSVIFDTFCYYPDDIRHRPPAQRLKLGVTYKDIKPGNGAQPMKEVVSALEKIFDKAGIIVGHSIRNDMQMLRDVDWNSHSHKVRDTQNLTEYRRHALGLGRLAAIYLNQANLQSNEHSSVHDARATMELYLLRRFDIEKTQGVDSVHITRLPSTPSLSTSDSTLSSLDDFPQLTSSSSSSLSAEAKTDQKSTQANSTITVNPKSWASVARKGKSASH